ESSVSSGCWGEDSDHEYEWAQALPRLRPFAFAGAPICRCLLFFSPTNSSQSPQDSDFNKCTPKRRRSAHSEARGTIFRLVHCLRWCSPSSANGYQRIPDSVFFVQLLARARTVSEPRRIKITAHG